MQCLSPITITDVIKGQSTFPCGQCIACRINKTEEWAIRIMHEARLYRACSFLTLTYRVEDEPKNGCVSKRELQTFFKRYRKLLYEQGRFVRYFASGEYGDEKNRPHYHAVLFGIGHHILEKKLLEKAWDKGFVTIEELTLGRARYTARYCQKKLIGEYANWYRAHNLEPEFMLCSRKPGIGMLFAQKYIDEWIRNGYLIVEGKKKKIPQYYLSLKDKSEIDLIEYKKKRMLRELQRVAKKAHDAGKEMFEITDKEAQSAEQRERNIRAKVALTKTIL